MQQNYQQFKQVREFGDLFSDTFSFISDNWKSFFGGFLKLTWPFILISLLGNAYYQVQVSGNIFDNALSNQQDPFSFFSGFMPSLLLLGFSSFLLSVASYAYVNLYIQAYINNNGEIDLKDVQSRMYDKFLSISGLQLLVGISVFFGLLICFFPGLYLLVPLSFAVSVYVFDNMNVTDTFSHTFKLIRDNWWITFAAILVMSILIAFAGGIFQLPAFLYAVLKTTLSVQENDPQQVAQGITSDYVMIALNAIASFASSLFNLAFIIMTVYIYFNLNERHFGTGSFEQIDEIGDNS